MPLYKFDILYEDGTRKKMTLEAPTQERVKAIVRNQGNIALNVKEASALNADIDIGKVKVKDLAVFCQQMHSVLKAGVPVTEGLDMVARTIKNTKLKKAVSTVALKLKQGNLFSACLLEHSDVFPLIMTQMIRAGEESGQMDKVFDRLATQFEKSNLTQSKIKKAMAYPKMIVAVILIALVVVCAYVMPMFKDVFDDIGTELPITTKMFLGLGDLFTKYWYWTLIIVVFVFVCWYAYSHSEFGIRQLCTLKLKVPLLRSLEEKTASANLARTLSTLLKSGLDYPKALKISADTMGNVLFKEAVQGMIVDINNGLSLSDSVKRAVIFPDLMESMVEIGDNTGNVEQMLENSANYFEDEVETATVQLTEALNPIIIIVLGVFVACLVFSIYMPMFSIYSSIG